MATHFHGKLRSNVTGSKFRFVPRDSSDAEISVSYLPRIFRKKSDCPPFRIINVKIHGVFDSAAPWGSHEGIELDTVLPEEKIQGTFHLHFPSSETVIASVKNFQLQHSITKQIVLSFHKERKHVYRILWDPLIITQPIWVLSLGISSIERKICTQ